MTKDQRRVAEDLIQTMKDEGDSTDYIKYANLERVNVKPTYMKVIIGRLIELGLIVYLPDKVSHTSIMLTRSGKRITKLTRLFLFRKSNPWLGKIATIVFSAALSLLVGWLLLQPKRQEVSPRDTQQDSSYRSLSETEQLLPYVDILILMNT